MQHFYQIELKMSNPLWKDIYIESQEIFDSQESANNAIARILEEYNNNDSNDVFVFQGLRPLFKR